MGRKTNPDLMSSCVLMVSFPHHTFCCPENRDQINK